MKKNPELPLCYVILHPTPLQRRNKTLVPPIHLGKRIPDSPCPQILKRSRRQGGLCHQPPHPQPPTLPPTSSQHRCQGGGSLSWIRHRSGQQPEPQLRQQTSPSSAWDQPPEWPTKPNCTWHLISHFPTLSKSTTSQPRVPCS